MCLPSQTILKPISEPKITFTQETYSHQKTIVLVSQEEENSTIICQLLTAAEYQVVWLIDPSTAINQIKLLEPTLVILDQDLSELDITNVSESLQNSELAKKTKLVIFSLQITEKEWQYFSSVGVDDYLLKSMHPSNLLKKVDAMIKQQTY